MNSGERAGQGSTDGFMWECENADDFLERLRTVITALAQDQRITYFGALLRLGLVTENQVRFHADVEDTRHWVGYVGGPEFRRMLSRNAEKRELVQRYLPDVWAEWKPNARQLRAGARWCEKHGVGRGQATGAGRTDQATAAKAA